MTNLERAERARVALDAYISHTDDVTDEAHFCDLLCDLMHLAALTTSRVGGKDDALGGLACRWDFDAELARGRMHFEAERPQGWRRNTAL